MNDIAPNLVLRYCKIWKLEIHIDQCPLEMRDRRMSRTEANQVFPPPASCCRIGSVLTGSLIMLTPVE